MNTRKVIGFAVGPIGAAGLGLLLVPAIAWAFTPEDVGRLNILQVVVSFSVLLLSLGLDQGFVRQYYETSDVSGLLKSCFLPGLVLFAVTALLGVVLSGRLSLWLFGESIPMYFWVTFICAFVAYVSRFLSLILRMQERAVAFSMSQLIPKAVLLFAVGLIILLSLPRRFLQLQLAFLMSTVAVLLIYVWNTRKQWKPALGASIDPQQFRILLGYSFPLIFAGLAFWGLSATSALALRSISSFHELGIYSVSTSFAGVAVIVQAIFTVIWAPVLYKWVADDADMSRVDRVARQGLAVVCGVFVICGMFSWLIDYVLPSQYAEVKYLVVCSIVQPLLYTLSEVTSVGISIMRRTMLSLWSTLAALLTNLGLNLLLVPHFGASGAVVANAIAFLVFFVARTESSAFVWRRFPQVKLYVFTTSAVVLSVLTVVFGPMIGMLFSVIWVLVLPFVAWAFREEWRQVLSALRTGIQDLRKVEVDR